MGVSRSGNTISVAASETKSISATLWDTHKAIGKAPITVNGKKYYGIVTLSGSSGITWS